MYIYIYIHISLYPEHKVSIVFFDRELFEVRLGQTAVASLQEHAVLLEGVRECSVRSVRCVRLSERTALHRPLSLFD